MRVPAHLRLVILVCLRTAASAEAPSAPMLLYSRLQARGRMGNGERVGACQWALTRKRTLWGGGVLEVGDLRLLEDGGERSGSLVSDVVVSETVSEGKDGNGERVGACQCPLTRKQTLGRRRTSAP